MEIEVIVKQRNSGLRTIGGVVNELLNIAMRSNYQQAREDGLNAGPKHKS